MMAAMARPGTWDVEKSLGRAVTDRPTVPPNSETTPRNAYIAVRKIVAKAITQKATRAEGTC